LRSTLEPGCATLSPTSPRKPVSQGFACRALRSRRQAGNGKPLAGHMTASADGDAHLPVRPPRSSCRLPLRRHHSGDPGEELSFQLHVAARPRLVSRVHPVTPPRARNVLPSWRPLGETPRSATARHSLPSVFNFERNAARTRESLGRGTACLSTRPPLSEAQGVPRAQSAAPRTRVGGARPETAAGFAGRLTTHHTCCEHSPLAIRRCPRSSGTP
jgi:hypothetical protein